MNRKPVFIENYRGKKKVEGLGQLLLMGQLRLFGKEGKQEGVAMMPWTLLVGYSS